MLHPRPMFYHPHSLMPLSLLLLSTLAFLTPVAQAQTDNSPVSTQFTDPTGKACTSGTGAIYALTGGMFTCQSGVFALWAGGSGTFIALYGDATSTASGGSTTVKGINGVVLSALSTGILKNTTVTGTPSIAAASDVVHVFGSGSCSGYLKSDGSCDIPTGSMTWPAAGGIVVYGGSGAWGASITAPSGEIVGTTDAQTLTNKTVDGVTPAVFGYLDATSSIQTQLNAKAAIPASGTLALATSSIASGACQAVTQGTVNSVAATGATTSSVIPWSFNGSIGAVTGYAPSTLGGLSVTAYPTTGYVNFDVCNWTAASITPGAVTVNWRLL